MSYLFLVSLIWAFSFGLIKGQLTTLDPHFVAWARMAIALPLFLPFLKISKLSTKKALYLMLIGAVQYGMMYLCLIRSFRYLQAHQVALLTTTTPIYVTLLSDFIRKEFRPYFFFTAIIAIIGAMVISYKPGALDTLLIGVLLVEGSGIAFSFGQVAYKYFRQKESGLQDSQIYALLYIGAFIVCAIATTLTGGWESISTINSTQLYTLLYLGVIASGLCFYWWNKGAVKTHAGTLAVFNNLKIPLGVAVSLLVFGEKVNLTKLTIGGVLILAALVLSELRARQKR